MAEFLQWAVSESFTSFAVSSRAHGFYFFGLLFSCYIFMLRLFQGGFTATADLRGTLSYQPSAKENAFTL